MNLYCKIFFLLGVFTNILLCLSVTGSIESSCSNQGDSNSDFTDKVLVSPPLMIHPSGQQKNDHPGKTEITKVEKA